MTLPRAEGAEESDQPTTGEHPGRPEELDAYLRAVELLTGVTIPEAP